MVAAVRQGESARAVGRRFHRALKTVQYWLTRAGTLPLDLVDWGDRPSRPQQSPRRTSAAVEQQILETRQTLRTVSDLGEYGAVAIHAALTEAGVCGVPSLRTINRVLERHGAFDGQRRQRWPAPPRGWYLPDVATGLAELEQFDVIEGLILEGQGEVQVLTGIALHSGLCVAAPTPTVTATFVSDTLLAHWQAVGCPAYIQFDNDTRFQGPHQHPDVIGRVMRLALGLGITVVFAPPRETGFQAAIESFNGRFQQKVWARFHHDDLPALQACTARYLAAVLRRCAPRFEAAPARHAVPPDWNDQPSTPPWSGLWFAPHGL